MTISPSPPLVIGGGTYVVGDAVDGEGVVAPGIVLAGNEAVVDDAADAVDDGVVVSPWLVLAGGEAVVGVVSPSLVLAGGEAVVEEDDDEGGEVSPDSEYTMVSPRHLQRGSSPS